jgi:hypothetical protein
MKRIQISMAAALLMMSAAVFAQKGDLEGQGQAILTVLPSHPAEQDASLTMAQVQVKVNGKQASVTALTPLKGADDRLEIVLLIDGSIRLSMWEQSGDITKFIDEAPSDAKITIAYMQSGQAALAGPLSSDSAAVLRGLHMTGGSPGSNGSPYFCLSDLAKRWPSGDRGARRVVVMITDGVDEFDRSVDPEDPYMQAAINDSVRAGVTVYSMYWHDQGRASNTGRATVSGQNLLQQVTQATGGNSYWQGDGNAVSFAPYFEDLRSRLRNQFALSFSADFKGKPEVVSMKVKASTPAAKVTAPQFVYLVHAAVAAQ